MQLAPPVEQGYYMPHQAVVKEDALTTKVRIVFDASMTTDNGFSLNDVMLSGYKIQRDLIEMIIQNRKWRICITADVQQQYPNFAVNQHH